MTVKAPIARSTATAKKSSRKPSRAQRPMTGIANSRSNRAPYASRIVAASTTKAQKVKKCATPGTLHCSSLRCPNTSRSWLLSRVPMSSSRPGAGWPERMSRVR